MKIDYAFAKVSTRYGISGVKVWISYSKKQKGMCSHKQVTGWPSTATSAMSLMSPLMEGKLKDMN